MTKQSMQQHDKCVYSEEQVWNRYKKVYITLKN